MVICGSQAGRGYEVIRGGTGSIYFHTLSCAECLCSVHCVQIISIISTITNSYEILFVRHVTGNDQDYLGESPEWLFRYLHFSKRATIGVRGLYAQPMLPGETPV